ncbi:MAG: hypothetical protein ACK5XV_04200 [Flavobacteriales bacterium]|jgi:drug/metabolite transporter (DMT)-like permease
MTFLIFSILTNAGIYLLFKWYQQLDVRIFPAIVFNYLTAFSLGFLLVPDKPAALEAALKAPVWTTGGLCLGVVFIAIFYLMAMTAQRVGVAVSTIASKMSLALAALLFAWADPAETLGPVRGLAILLAVGGVVCSSVRGGQVTFDRRLLVWPILILLGSTVIDFGIAWLSKEVEDDNQLTLFSSLSFFTAGITGAVLLVIRQFTGIRELRMREAVAGIGLGLVNFGSIYFLVNAYDSGLLPRSSLLPVNNLSVVIIGAAAAMLFFRERLSRLNWIGVVLSISALMLLLLGEP